MAKLLKMFLGEASDYKDRRFEGDQDDWNLAMATSCTVYVGNLSFYTTEDQIHEVFSKAGKIKQIIMGLDRHNKTPCGFCFVEYFTNADALDSVKYINGIMVDERPIRVDIDWGFQEGRQYGRGRSGGQVRDEFRMDYDPGRGGYGHILTKEVAYMHQQQHAALDVASPTGRFEPAAKRRRGGEPAAARNPRFRDAESDEERERDREEPTAADDSAKRGAAEEALPAAASTAPEQQQPAGEAAADAAP